MADTKEPPRGSGRTGPVPESPDADAGAGATATHSIPGLDIPEEEVAPPVPKNAALRALHFAYYVVLLKAETAVLLALLAGVVLLPLIEIINRNTHLNIWDSTLATRIAYIFTFYVGLFGGAFATRYGRHISVDLVQPHLPPRVRHRLSGLLFLVSAVAGVALTRTAWRLVFWVIGPDDRFFPSVEKWWGRDRVWKIPFIVGFALMTLHFTVEGVRRLFGPLPGHKAPAGGAPKQGAAGEARASAPVSAPAPAAAAKGGA
ncbi:MAG TPA: TRAP transporter small permease [Myxococcota bacterium]|nr:TRAP transporter small permease [Myxococcota bacterium]